MSRTGMDAHLFETRKPAHVESAGVLDFFTDVVTPPLPAPETDEEKALSERFAAFHIANPGVYDEIKRRAIAMMQSGARRIGVKRIVEDMRDEWSTRTVGDVRQLNNIWTSRYARLLCQDVPELRPLIETRAMRSA